MLNSTKTFTVSGVTFIRAQGLRPVYCHFEGQCNAQPAYIRLCPEEGRAYPDYSSEIGGGCDAAVWHEREYLVGIDPRMKTPAINRMMREMAPVISEIFAGYSDYYDGGNWCGRLTQDAAELLHDLDVIAEDYASDPANLYDLPL